MGFEELLDHKCNIYHPLKQNAELGFGLRNDKSFAYPDIPDITEAKCHFGVISDNLSLQQNEPQANVVGTVILSLLPHTDVRINDRVVSLQSGLAYRAGILRDIRGHHIKVKLSREDSIKGAI